METSIQISKVEMIAKSKKSYTYRVIGSYIDPACGCPVAPIDEEIQIEVEGPPYLEPSDANVKYHFRKAKHNEKATASTTDSK